MRLKLHIAGSALAGLLLAVPAHASHYFIQDVRDVFSELANTEFDRFGFQTTEDILRNVDTVDERDAFADVTGIPADEVLAITQLCDFLQIEGVGPKAAHLLLATGVQTVADLAAREAGTLTAEIEVVNAVHQITGVNPDVAIVQAWIDAAGRVPLRVAYAH